MRPRVLTICLCRVCDPDGVLNAEEADAVQVQLNTIAEAGDQYPASDCSANGFQAGACRLRERHPAAQP